MIWKQSVNLSDPRKSEPVKVPADLTLSFFHSNLFLTRDGSHSRGLPEGEWGKGSRGNVCLHGGLGLG